MKVGRVGFGVAVVLLSASFAGVAHADVPPTITGPPTGIIAGRVTGTDTGAGIAGICVKVSSTARFPNNVNNYQVTTERDGRYHVLVADDTYLIRFTDCRSAPAYITQDLGHTVSGVGPQRADAALVPRGFLTGTVTDDATGAPVAGICVQPIFGGGFGPYGQGTTDANGHYLFSVDGQPSSSWEVYFGQCSAGSPVYAPDFYHHAGLSDQATPFTIASGATTTIDETLRVGGIVTGQVVDAVTGVPIAGINVWAQPTTQTKQSQRAVTAADGTYSLAGLYAGQFKLQYSDYFQCRYQTQWWQNKTSPDNADLVDVGFGTTTSNVNVALQPGDPCAG